MEAARMAQQSKREYLRSTHGRYRQAGRAEKGQILEEFCKLCGYQRKYAVRLLNRPLPEAVPQRRRRRRMLPLRPTLYALRLTLYALYVEEAVFPPRPVQFV